MHWEGLRKVEPGDDRCFISEREMDGWEINGGKV